MKSRLYITLLAAAVLLQGCMKDELDGTACPDAQGTQITLSMGDMPVVETRSAASPNEKDIDIAQSYVLVFGTDGTYKAGEKIQSISDVTTATTRTITTSLAIAGDETVVVLGNTGYTALPDMTGTTVNDINTKFRSQDKWNFNKTGSESGKGLPMSGTLKWVASATTHTVVMTRSVAKIQLALASGFSDMTKTFAQSEAVTWGLFSAVQVGNIYHAKAITDADYAPSIPTSPISLVFRDPNLAALPLRLVDIGTPDQQSCYTPEFPCATKTKDATKTSTVTVAATEWAQDRTCLIVHTSAGFYRIDLAKGNGYNETKQFLDILRNTHYVVTITKIKSWGYDTAQEALKNPSSNLEYEVTITGDEDNFTTSNGQYAVTSDKEQIAVVADVPAAAPEKLVKFFCKANGVANVVTRTIKLVGADKTSVIPATELQMCLADGTPITDNNGTYTQADEAGCQLTFSSPSYGSLPYEQCYVEIGYGNIRHYVPICSYRFEVTAPTASFRFDGSLSYNYTVSSFKKPGYEIVAWTAAEFSIDGGATWTSRDENVVPTFTEGAAGNTGNVTFPVQLGAQTGIYPHTDILKKAGSVTGTYDLSTNGGTTPMNTANCYIVNKAGKYSLPLVYGNAIVNGATNKSAYSTNNTGNNILSVFIRHDGNKITDPYIKTNGFTATKAQIVWQDAENLVTNVAISGNTLTFTVPTANICQGNAVIAVLDASDNVLWSWHIWVTDFNPNTETGAPKSFDNFGGITYKFMPYNIGWCDGQFFPARTIKVRFTQKESGIQRIIDLNQIEYQEIGSSPYFQWGRKDPFVGAHINFFQVAVNKTWYDGSGNMKTNTPPTVASPAWTTDMSGNVIQNGILNPDVYCANNTADQYYGNLWSANHTTTITEPSLNDNPVTKTIYDPSPVGYHIPASNAFTGFSTSGRSENKTENINKNGDWNNGWTFSKAGSDDVFFPAVSYRYGETGALSQRALSGNYWTAIPSYLYAAPALDFSFNWIGPVGDAGKAAGFSVRCVQE